MNKKNFNPEDVAVSQLMNSKERDKLYNRLDEFQKQLKDSFNELKMIMVDAPAGTGKTLVSTLAALEHLTQNKCKRILYIRFPSKRGEKLGAVPGELNEKEAKYMFPFYEALNDCGLQDETVEILEQNGMIETCSDVTLRGRTLKNCFVIVDEAQNAADIEELRLVLTRIKDSGSSSSIVGHSEQIDSKIKTYGKQKLNAFQVYQIHMTKKNWCKKIELYHNYRGAISQWADKIEETLKEIEE